ncbi:hypothetical protein K501DRAFT_277378 [Backusella circina FSU 941]|nr:hypothetical protein K501DRAFT_277378 [Backusella circina FSU 941]
MWRPLCFSRSFTILYDPLSTSVPVFIQVQNQTDETLLVRDVHFSTPIYERYKKNPILVIIKVASATVQFMRITELTSDFLFAKYIPCTDWAKRRCFKNGDKVSTEKALYYVDDDTGFLQRQKIKYCEVLETASIKETPPLVYLNKIGRLQTLLITMTREIKQSYTNLYNS